MSWLPLTDEDASALDIHEAQDGRGLVSQSRETLESRLLDAEARLATERESHCQTKEALQALTRESRDVSHQLFEANAQLAAAQEALKARSDELKVQNTLRENLETALRHAQERFEGGSAASSSTRRPRTRSQDKDLQQCEACSSKDQELRDTTARLLLLETQHAQLATQKATLESAHVHLANQLAALEKVAERKQDALRSDNDALKDEINDLKDANRDLVADSERRTRDHVQAIRSAEAGREQVANQSEAAQKALHDAQVNLEARTEELQALREEHESLQSKSDADVQRLENQIQVLETHFQSANSDLLSSRAALNHTRTKLNSLETILNQMPQRSFDDAYVTDLQHQLSEESTAREGLERLAASTRERLAEVLREQAQHDGLDEKAQSPDEPIEAPSLTSIARPPSQDSGPDVRAELLREIDLLRVALEQKDGTIRSLQDELSSLVSVKADVKQQAASTREELEFTRLALLAKEEELLSIIAEFECLKRDATSLRDQLLLQQRHSAPSSPGTASSNASSPLTPSPRRRHMRTSSAPFCPSPLRNALVVDGDSMQFSPVRPIQMDEDEDRSLVLIARLRQERDEAVQQVSFRALEHKVALHGMQQEVAAEKAAQDAALTTVQAEKDEIVAKLQTAVEREEDARRELRLAMMELAEAQTSLDGAKEKHSSLETDNSHLSQRIVALQRERDELCEQLDRLHSQFEGAGNVALDLQKRLGDVAESATMAEARMLESSQEAQDQLDQRQLQLEGASNAAVELQKRIEATEERHSMLVSSLTQQRNAMYQALLQERARHDIQQSQLKEAEVKRNDIEGQLTTVEQARDALIVALAQQCTQTRSIAKDASLTHQTLVTRNEEAERLAHELEEVEGQLASERHLWASRIAETSDTSSGAGERDKTMQSLILCLAQAAKDAQLQRNTCLVHTDQLARLQQYSQALQDQLQTARAALEQAAEERGADAASLLLKDDITRLEAELQGSHGTAAALREELSLTKMQHSDHVQLVEAELETLSATLAASQREQETLTEQAVELHGILAAIKADLAHLQSSLSSKEREVLDLQEQLEQVHRDADALRENLRAAEEEGRNLVDDFNALSEEFERTQQQMAHLQTSEEARPSENVALLQARQVELEGDKQSLLEQKAELEERVKELEQELDNKQVEAEETDDRYLASLKTIKKQALALDKLKVRIEALQRANSLLNKAMPTAASQALAPQPASQKKRGLPADFVAPDPGPTAIITSTTPSRSKTPAKAFSVKADEIAEQGYSAKTAPTKIAETQASNVTLPPSTSAKGSSRMSVSAATSDGTPKEAQSSPQQQPRAITSARKPLAAISQPAVPQPAVAALNEKASRSAADPPVKPISTEAPPSTKPILRASGLPPSASGRPAFKPTPSLNSKPLPRAEARDTKSLLAALQAMKRPV